MKKYIIKKSTKKKILKGCKGAISLFMVVLMVPFLQIAFALLEIGRYNSVVSLFDEAAGVSATSTLASFDKYLEQRWGLLALDQGKDINQIYADSLKKNGDFAGDGYTLSKASAKGINSLTEGKFLYNQIIEYSKLNVPTKLVTDILGNIPFSDFIEGLEKMADIENILNLITSEVNTVDSAITLTESAEKLKELANNIDSHVSTCNDAYNAFKNSVNDLVSALKEPRPSEKAALDEKQAKANKEAEGKTNEDGTPVEPETVTLTAAEIEEVKRQQKAYDDNISSLRSTVTSKKNTYKSALGEAKKELESYKTEMATCQEAIESVQKNVLSVAKNITTIEVEASKKNKELENLKKEIENIPEEDRNDINKNYTDLIDKKTALEKETAALQIQKTEIEATQKGLGEMNEKLGDTLETYSDENLQSVIDRIDTVRTNLDSLSSDNISKSYSFSEEKFKVTIGGYVSADKIDSFIADQEKKMREGSLKAMLEGVGTFIESVFSMSLIYEPSLSAVINTGFYDSNLGGLPGEKTENELVQIIKKIGEFTVNSGQVVANFASLKLIEMLKEIKETVESGKDLLNLISSFAVNTLNRIASIFTSPDRVFYSTYATFMVPCRTNLGTDNDISFSNLTGFSLGAKSLPKQPVGSTSLTVIDDFSSAATSLTQKVSGGDDYTFSGAELEYILFGDDSEILNQTFVFFSLYVVRLLLNIAPVLSNPEIQAIAAASTFGYPVVMLLVILAEPLADTFVLVNGGKVSLLKTFAYISPTGLPRLISAISSIVGTNISASKEKKDKIQADLASAFGASGDDYDYQKKLLEYEQSNPDTGTTSNGKLKEGFSDFFALNYRQHCFALMLIFISEAELMGRLSNLIQMETLYYYKEVDKGKSGVTLFDLKKSYTYLNVDATIKVTKMLPTLLASDFEVDRKLVRGY